MRAIRQGAARWARPLSVLLYLYLFLVGIELLGHAFSLFGEGFAEGLLRVTSNPFAGLLAGVLATTLVQSSSTTTSITVGLVAGGGLTLETAIPIIMGANVGTTLTNTLVALGHAGHRLEFRRAFSAGVLHDLFNVLAVLVLFPIELRFGLIARAATAFERSFAGIGGVALFDPLAAALDPAVAALDWMLAPVPATAVVLTVVALGLMFVGLARLARTMRTLLAARLEVIVDRFVFRNDALGLVFGVGTTILVQSSSITTSLVVPLAGAGLVRLRQLFPFLLGANLGTTVTAILAALATQNEVAVTVAFAHLLFNLFGMAVFYPLRVVPLALAHWVGSHATASRRNLVVFVGAYLLVYLVPTAFVVFG